MLTYKNSSLVLHNTNFETPTIKYKSPSNLAIVKYWGKYGVQLPCNPSISLTLNHAFTETTLDFKPKANTDKGHQKGISLDFYFEEKHNDKFKIKIEKFLTSLTDIFPFLTQLDLTISSYNSFPHSAGIASSASSMSALALCLCELERSLFGTLQEENEFLKKASFISRLGSGSACRSVYPVAGMWGELDNIEEASNLFAIPFQQHVHPVFETFHDDILIISKAEKSVSSRAGHALMEGNIYAVNRYEQAKNRCKELMVAFKTGDVDKFGQIAENEALTLHALMMCSEPSYMLMKPNSITVIEKVRAYRAATQQPLYFSLDAGPNLHLLYPDAIKDDVQEFIKTELTPYCEDGMWIADTVGQGAERVV